MLVVGGASGIGRATVDRARDLGAQVAVLDRAPPAVDAGGGSLHLRGDATDPEVVATQVGAAVEALGGLDALVHTAGVHDGFRDLVEYPVTDLADVCSELWRVNVTSALLAVRAALPALHRSEHASVTLTSSESGFGARGGGAPYTASKWAVRGLVDHLAAELAPAIRVNGVAPGGTSGTSLRGVGSTPAEIGARPGRDEDLLGTTKLRRRIEAADVAGAYTYLASPSLARVITGVIINVDGGRNTV